MHLSCSETLTLPYATQTTLERYVVADQAKCTSYFILGHFGGFGAFPGNWQLGKQLESKMYVPGMRGN
jgi:hypothetical protein